jgi:hypothetical protein
MTVGRLGVVRVQVRDDLVRSVDDGLGVDQGRNRAGPGRLLHPVPCVARERNRPRDPIELELRQAEADAM